jgi:L-seryl-tRNA(Ser) seleniumtransferase
MNPPADSAARPKNRAQETPQNQPFARLRDLPSVDQLLSRPGLLRLAHTAGQGLVTQAARSVLADVRNALKNASHSDIAAFDSIPALEARVAAEVEAALSPSLKPVINATGVILHTNLGRAPLPPEAAAQIAETATRYSNLEYHIASGERGRRDVHTAHILSELTGAEAAIVVNNNAAAVFLVLNALAKGAEVIVSRGELIEIGDGFRIPDIMSESGALLHEVGTTNRTRIRDYERAINERTRLLLRVHPSNFRITGFTERPTLEELVALGHRTKIPVYEDLGSGCLADLAPSGVAEPVARASFTAGADVVSFSGDKLLGGPQAGIIAGKKELVERIRRSPLFRALRVDKLTIAALEVTLKSYLRGALDEIPALQMIRATPAEIRKRAEALVAHLSSAARDSARIEIREGHSVIGGGSTPDQQLPTHLVSVSSPSLSAGELEEKLRKPAHGEPVIARIEDDRVVLDLRTVLPSEEQALASALTTALA